jgi:hypothetical protein
MKSLAAQRQTKDILITWDKKFLADFEQRRRPFVRVLTECCHSLAQAV